MRKIIKVLGKPGTGKTTFLAKKILEKIENGYTFDDVLFTSYSRSAARAMYNKLYERGIERKELKNFGTIYSLANKTLGLSDGNYITRKDFICFAATYGVEFDPSAHKVKKLAEIEEFGVAGDTATYVEGNVLFQWWQFLKCVFIYNDDAREAIRRYYKLNERQQNVLMHRSNQHLLYLYDEWEKYKQERTRYEYQDMLQDILVRNIPYFSPFRFAFLDETHDFGPLQMDVLKLWGDQGYVEEVYICYDPLQTIYKFTGSDPSIVDNLVADDNITLPKSYRVPQLPWNIAIKMARSINDYSMDGIEPSDNRGDVIHIGSVGQLLMEKFMRNNESTFFLLRRNDDVREFMGILERARVPIRGIGRTQTIWKGKYFKDIYNLLLCLENDIPPTKEEVRSFLMVTPADLLKRGIKQDYNKRRFKHWGKDVPGGSKLFDDKISLFYGIFKDNVGSVSEVKEIISQPRIKLKYKEREYLLQVHPKDIFARDLKRFVGTYHASKGLDAENVILFDYYLKSGWDVVDETRLCYVGITRTLNNAYIVGDGLIGTFF